ncbi:hypothetical protein CRYUN_Cryun31cG0075600 [Craigia yunnanensis]
MTGIRLISTSIVQAANPKNQAQKIELTPWDLQFLLAEYIQRGLLFHMPELNQEEESETVLVHYVKTSLSKALDHFSPLTGRLATIEHDNDTISFSIDCNNTGALFVHATVDEVTTQDITQPVYVPSIVDSFFPLHGVKNYEGTIKPLLAVQVTRLVDGVFISVSINHSVIDGASFFHFFSSWLEIARGSSSLSKPPNFQRCFLNATNCHPVRIPNSYIKQIENEFNVPSPVKVRVFHFTNEVIAKLKEKANAEVGIKNEISSLQALLSHFWRSVVRNKKIDPNEETSYCLLIGARQRLQELSEGYFGNALQVGTITMKAKELLDHGLGNTAWQMNKVVASYNEETLRNFLESWKECPKLKRMSNMVRNIAIVTSDSPRFDIYGGDAGLGRPVAIRSGPANKFDGRITVHCGVEKGSIDIEVCLSLETFQAMENDKEFMDTVSIKS